MSQLETDIKNNAYKRVWQMAASLSDENGLAMPEDLMFKNFEGLDKEILKWKVGYEKSIQQKEQIKELEENLTLAISTMNLALKVSNERGQQIKALKERLHNAEKTLIAIDSLHNDSERTSELVHEHFISTDKH